MGDGFERSGLEFRTVWWKTLIRRFLGFCGLDLNLLFATKAWDAGQCHRDAAAR